MGHLSSDAYNAKANYAHSVALDNRNILLDQGVEDEIIDAIDSLCSTRHTLHTTDYNNLYMTETQDHTYLTDMLSDYTGEGTGLENIIKLITIVDTSNTLSVLKDVSDKLQFMDNDAYDEVIEEYKDTHSDEEEGYQEEIDKITEQNKQAYIKFKEVVNDAIEGMLRLIDDKYGTSYRPSGATRVY